MPAAALRPPPPGNCRHSTSAPSGRDFGARTLTVSVPRASGASSACARPGEAFASRFASTPITRRDAEGNSYQARTLDDGSVHEVLKNFPSRDQAFAALGPRARDPQWIEFDHYWVLRYTLR